MLTVLMLLLPLAQADVGPAPKCPEGTYSAYCMGRRCVPNDKALDAQCNEVPAPAPPAKPTEEPAKPADPAAPADPKPAEPAKPMTPAKHSGDSGGCANANYPGALSAGAVAMLSAALLRRRRQA